MRRPDEINCDALAIEFEKSETRNNNLRHFFGPFLKQKVVYVSIAEGVPKTKKR